MQLCIIKLCPIPSSHTHIHTHTHTHTVGFITFRFRSNSKCVHNRGLQYKTIIWIFTTAPLSSRTLVFCMQESVSILTTPLLVLAVLTWTHLYIGVSVRFPARIENWERERESFFHILTLTGLFTIPQQQNLTPYTTGSNVIQSCQCQYILSNFSGDVWMYCGLRMLPQAAGCHTWWDCGWITNSRI